MIYEVSQGPFTISTDRSRLELQRIHQFLVEGSYWANQRTFEVMQRSTENSLCFGVYNEQQQVGFARVVTDYATFAWLCDVFILPDFRGQGLSKWLVQTVVECPELQSLRRILLATRDAHELYRVYGGFQPLKSPERWMERFNQ